MTCLKCLIYLFISNTKQTEIRDVKAFLSGHYHCPFSSPELPAKQRCACAAEYISQDQISLLSSLIFNTSWKGLHHCQEISPLLVRQRKGTKHYDFVCQYLFYNCHRSIADLKSPCHSCNLIYRMSSLIFLQILSMHYYYLFP